jgi:hypothetical protein
VALQGALEGFRAESLKFLLPYIQSFRDIHEIMFLVEDAVGGQFNRIRHLLISDRIAECLILLLEHYPNSFRALVLNNGSENVADRSDLVYLGSIELFETIRRLGIEISSDVVIDFLRNFASHVNPFPNRCIPAIDYLLRIPGMKHPSMIQIFDNSTFPLARLICRADALPLLKFLDSIAGPKVFERLSETDVLKCVRFSTDGRFTIKTPLDEFLEWFMYVFERSKMNWTDRIRDEVQLIESSYIQGKWEELMSKK